MSSKVKRRKERAVLSSPSSARKVTAISVPHTPRLVIAEEDIRPVEEVSKENDTPATIDTAGRPQKTVRQQTHRRSLSQPIVLSDSSDSDGGQGASAKLHYSVQGSIVTQSANSPPRKSAQSTKAIDRGRLRKVMQDNEEGDMMSVNTWMALEKHQEGMRKTVPKDAKENNSVKQAVVVRGTQIVDDLSSDDELTGFRKSAPRKVGRLSNTTEKEPHPPKQHKDFLRVRGTSLPIWRALCANCFDVGGFLCASPVNLNATTNLREFRGKIVLMFSQDLVHAGRFSSAGACALVVISKDPEGSGNEYNPPWCRKETKIPVVFISESGAKNLNPGSLAKITFDVENDLSNVASEVKMSKNASVRRTSFGNKHGTSEDGKDASLQRSGISEETSADSQSDNESDAEFCLVRRRRQLRGATPAKENLTSKIDKTPALKAHFSSTIVTASEAFPDDGSVVSSGLNQNSLRRGAEIQLRMVEAHAASIVLSGINTELGQAGVKSTPMTDSVGPFVEELMRAHCNDFLYKLDYAPLPEEKNNRVIDAIAVRLNEGLCSTDTVKKSDSIYRLRELCKTTKDESIAHEIVDAVIRLPGAVEAFWNILAGPPAGCKETSDEPWLRVQVATSICLRRAALKQQNIDTLLSAPCSVTVLGRILVNETSEDLRQKLAALVANMSVQEDRVRNLLCRDESVIRGLCQLLFTPNNQVVDSSLAALSNLSLDARQTGLILKYLNLERVVMILLSGGSKSCHRGAGLVRNLLFSTKTRASIAQVPGILKALRKLQTSNDSDTQQRSTIALSMLIEYQQESGCEEVSMLERKLMDTGDKSHGTLQNELQNDGVDSKNDSESRVSAGFSQKGSSVSPSKSWSTYVSAVTHMVSPSKKAEKYHCNFRCGFTSTYAEVEAHEASCSKRPSIAMKTNGLSTNSSPKYYDCNFRCGFTSTYAEVEAHEGSCSKRPSTAMKTNDPSKNISSTLSPDAAVERLSASQDVVKQGMVSQPLSTSGSIHEWILKQEMVSQPASTSGKAVLQTASTSGKAISTNVPSTPLPDEASIEEQFRSLEMSKIDLFSPGIQPVSPRVNVEASAITPAVLPFRQLPAQDQTSTVRENSNLPAKVHRRVAGIPAQSTPPQHPGASARLSKQQEETPGLKIEKAVDVAAADISRIVSPSNTADMLDAVNTLRARLQSGSQTCTLLQDEIGSDGRLLTNIGRLLSDDPCIVTCSQLLGLLRDLCKGHAGNVHRLCCSDTTLTAVLRIALKCDLEKKDSLSAIAAEIVSFCMIDDGHWDKVTSARSRVMKAHSLATTHNASNGGSPKRKRRSPLAAKFFSQSTSVSDRGRSEIQHSANYTARQAVILQEWSA